MIAASLVLASSLVAAAVDAGGHEDPVARVALALAIVLSVAKLGADLAVRIRQPAVLGELVAGVIVGNLPLVGITSLGWIADDSAIDMLARVGVLILLFEVGLESSVRQMMKVGLSSLVVAVLGVVTPLGLGWACSAWMAPGASVYIHAFVGATLSATSVGITARVLKDLGRSEDDEARIILGAAVIDDVLGLVVLALVVGAIAAADRGTEMDVGQIVWIVFEATGFLVGALVLGRIVSRRLFFLASRLKARNVLLAVGLAFCFGVSWVSSLVGLAPIVGAFASGLVLESVHYRDFVDRGEHELEELIAPISAFLVPVFFVTMGLRTHLGSFADPSVVALAALLTLAAVIGKQACALGVLEKGLDRLSVGIGMIPRGEVGLIFASTGASMTVAGKPVVDTATFSAIVMMVISTTLITPPALKWSLGRRARAK